MQTEIGWTIVTGSTGGIGSEIVKLLASQGSALLLINRSKAKAKDQLAYLRSLHPSLKAELVTADLMNVETIASATEQINRLPGRVDAIYNNAGVLTGKKSLSVQGFESHFAVNTLAPYQLIQDLRAKMSRAENERPAMVTNFSSSAINSVKSMDVVNLANPDIVGGLMTTYAQTKLAVTAMALALADELKRDNILIRAIDPGPTKTAMTTEGNSGMPWLLRWIAPLLFSPAHKQAAKVVAGSDPSAFERETGIYVANMKKKKMPVAATNSTKQRELIDLLDRSLEI
ncbi:MAG: SDR family NAD(P)-dependent oxidoreductase [Planctomycetota bacterium]